MVRKKTKATTQQTQKDSAIGVREEHFQYQPSDHNGNSTKPVDRISDDFIAMLQNSQMELNAALANLQSARAASQFVQRSMAAAYQLKEGDQVNAETGEITRTAQTKGASQ